MVSYPIGDFLIRIKNAGLARKKEVSVSASKKLEAVAKAMKAAGFLNEVVNKEGTITVQLTYHRKEPVILGLELVSKPGRRIYISADELAERKGPEVLIVSTSKGVLPQKEAIKERVGGEVVAKVW